MQYDLRKVQLYLDVLVLAKPKVFIGMAQTKFDGHAGHCADEPTRNIVTDQMPAFERWIAAAACVLHGASACGSSPAAGRRNPARARPRAFPRLP
ncbi:MAG TPA: hypothetical protein VFQ16_06675 [Burkholderiaceae bacterium]|nr:hypothetical protein [Burkholderiaceae bacterium]